VKRLSVYGGVALVSASVLALQVIFTRIFSIMIWHHFTYLIVGVALLGGGAAGVFLAVRQWRHEVIRRRLGPLALTFSLSTLAMLAIITFVHFDPLRTDDLLWTVAGLAIYFVGLFATFMLGGLVIAGAFSVYSQSAHRLYFADLLGAGVATLAAVWVVRGLSAPSAIILVALLATTAALLFGAPPRWRWAAPAVLAGVHALEPGGARRCHAQSHDPGADDRRRHQPAVCRCGAGGGELRPQLCDTRRHFDDRAV
jgi:hypothetical protein